ncbi:hypothetical protein [Salinimicrobium sp. WS361]|uniref:hypothetical protein n=1 Tax=Salinimicrobium sp. WS361 TaxID=3425123 RepID=UPI003D6F1846
MGVMEEKFKPGDEVLYQGKENFIEEIYPDGEAKIKNPSWDWDEEGEYVEADETYDEPFWIYVPLSELKKK